MSPRHIRSFAVVFLLACVAALRGTAASTGAPAPVAEALVEARIDVKETTEALVRLREEHSEARRPLVAKLTALQAKVKQLRAEVENNQRTQRDAADTSQGLAARVEALVEAEQFMTGLLTEYRRSLETRTNCAEIQRLRERLAEIDEGLAGADGVRLVPQIAGRLLGLAEDWNRARLGGVRFEGEAVDAAGAAQVGTFALIGPVVYFAARDAEVCGPTESHLGGLCPAVFSHLTPDEQGAVRDLCAGSETVVPLDVTLGDALKVAAAKPSMLEHLQKGGVVMVPLVVVGVLAFILALVKSISLACVRVDKRVSLGAVLDGLRVGNVEGARAAAAILPGPLRAVVQEGIEHCNAPKEHLEELLTERVMALIPSLEKHLALLAVLGGVAPLLGLLGTVTGMIHTFQLVTLFGSGDARLLSGGISEALVTTEVGLAIAIPVLLVHAFLARRVRTIVAVLERMAMEFVHALKIRGNTGD